MEEFKDCFKETLEVFPLIKGKYDETQEEQVQCQFKGKFLLFKETESLNQDFGSLLKKYGGFLALSPPNTPILLKIRIYIIKATLNVVGPSNPYLCINVGDGIYETTYSYKQNNAEKEFIFAK